jgi:type VI secretion system protein ImpB
MPRDESLQHKLDRIRKPRVQITYDVQVGDAQIVKELPFVLGVLADLAGHPDPDAPPLAALKDEKRKFVEINRDNFDRVMGGIKPRLAIRVPNRIENNDTKLGVELKFKSVDDFEPVNVVKQVEPLKKLLEARERLAELKSKITTNDRFNDLLQRIIHDTDQLERLGRETGRVAPGGAPSSGTPTQGETAPASEETKP